VASRFPGYNVSRPNYRRARIDGGTYFFTVTTFRRQPFLTDADVRAALRAGIARVRTTHPFIIGAWALLPDHMHAVWTLPPNDRDFSTRWRVIKRTVTQQCRARLHRPEWMTPRRALRQQSTLWQHRFWEHTVRDELDFERHVNYIHWNPVKHGYVRQVADWPYSSFRRYVKQGLLPRNWGGTGAEEDDADFGE
jgi:putative transposase